MGGPLRDLAAATGFLTRLPVGNEVVDGDLPDVVGWYPAVGLLLGAAAYVPVAVWASLAEPGGPQGLLAATLVLAWWAWLTRMLHWDGLADTADGLWGAFEPARRLEIMSDSRVGAFGATALVLVALVQAAALGVLIAGGTLWPILLAPVTARAGAMLACWALPAAREEGLGFSTVAEPSVRSRLVAAAVLAVAIAVVGLAAWREGADLLPVLGILLAGDVLAILVPRVLSRPLGGVTGDVLGASIVLVETGILAVAALVL